MKKNHIALAFIAAAVLCSCNVNEQFNGESELGKNEIAFYLKSAQTKASEDYSAVETKTLQSIPVGQISGGLQLFLEESVTSLDGLFFAPETKGTPAYTANTDKLYGKFKAIAYKNNTSTVALNDAEFVVEGTKWRHVYDVADPLADGALRFFMRMPADFIDGLNPNLKYNTNGSLEFDYTSPETAAEMQDILFTSRVLDKSTYDAKEGARLLFHHALTGIKFRIGNELDEIGEKGISIDSVRFIGLQTSGHCTLTPNDEGGNGDVTDNYSSATCSVWGTSELEGKKSIEIYQKFSSTLADYSKTKYPFPDSFNGNNPQAPDYDQNLNDNDASLTFWVIPQTIKEDLILKITYTYGGKQGYFMAPLGSLLKGTQWKAGQLRTYTIRVDEVNVMIEDNVSVAEKTTQEVIDSVTGDTAEVDSYYGSTKTNVTITNTGNTDAYIRAAIIGQWLDADGNPVFGFTDYTHEIALVDSWYQDQFVTKKHEHGEFEGLVGYDSNYSGDWVLGEDGYYYYTQIVPAGQSIPSTDPLFTKYTVKECPAVSIAGAIKNVYFVLEIATQAISAKKIDGSTWATYDAAWDNAKAQEE
ncbi:MAG: hypothetical protein IKO88_05920 [Bacteroidales bacterium]|nr:hypothetical protein [Bacteroidales bacterium]